MSAASISTAENSILYCIMYEYIHQLINIFYSCLYYSYASTTLAITNRIKLGKD